MRSSEAVTRWIRLSRDPSLVVTFAAALALLLPPIVMGPWLPMLDLVGFVGLGNFPPTLSSGPLHFSVFQFTYIVHYALVRFLHDLGVPVPLQILAIYVLEAGVLFGVTVATIRHFVSHPWIASVAIAAGTLAFWDAMFIWGGPLPFSMAGAAMAVATLITVREITAPDERSRIIVALLAVLSLMCHPFAFPFAVLLAALRFWFVERCRRHSVLLIAVLTALAWVIAKDSAESSDHPQLTSLFSFSVAQLGKRALGLFVADGRSLIYLYGGVTPQLGLYTAWLGLVHLAGFVTAPFVFRFAAHQRALRFLAVLTACVGAMYFLSADNSVVTQWPQRILTFFSPFTFSAGVIFPFVLICRRRPALAAYRPPRRLWTVPVAILGLIVWIQIPVLQLGANIRDNYLRLRDGIVRSGLTNAYVVMADLDRIQPFYLRAVPFLLFSDAELVRRNLIFFTEWHVQPRHPTRLIENWFDTGRLRVLGVFSSHGGRIALRLDPQPPGVLPLGRGNNVIGNGADFYLAGRQIALGDQLLALGASRDAIAHYQAALEVAPDRSDVANNLGVALTRANRAAEAIPCFRTTVRLNPDNPEAVRNLGVVLVASGAIDEGIRHLETAVRLKPGLAQSRFELGAAFLKAGRRDDAIVQFDAALAADPNFGPAREQLARLRQP